MKRTHPRLFWRILVVTAGLLFSAASCATAHDQHSLVGMHGMVLLKDGERLYASHLPLFVPPHHYQLIYEVTFTDPMHQAQALAQFEQGTVTILPEQFDLHRLVEGETFALNTQLFRGHFERGGTPSFQAQLSFTQQVYLRRLSADLKVAQSQFSVVPIQADRALVVHHIEAAPSFDAVGFIEWQSETLRQSDIRVHCPAIETAVSESLLATLNDCLPLDWAYFETQDFQK